VCGGFLPLPFGRRVNSVVALQIEFDRPTAGGVKDLRERDGPVAAEAKIVRPTGCLVSVNDAAVAWMAGLIQRLLQSL